jgi:hypothetical protein
MFKFGKDYMKSFFDQLRLVVTRLKFAFDRFVTCDFLAESIRAQSDVLREHSESSNALAAAIREHSAALLTNTATTNSINRSVRYLEDAQKRELIRAGHPHTF